MVLSSFFQEGLTAQQQEVWSPDSLQPAASSGSASTAENHLVQGHALPGKLTLWLSKVQLHQPDTGHRTHQWATSTGLAWALLSLPLSSAPFSSQTCFFSLWFTISILILKKHLIPQTPSHGLLLKNPVCDTKCLLSLPIFLLSYLPFFLTSFVSIFYLIWIQVLCQIHVWQISLPLWGLLFHFFIVSLNRSPLFGYNSVSQFSFLDMLIVSYPKVMNKFSYISKAFIVLPFNFRLTCMQPGINYCIKHETEALHLFF